MTTQASPDSGTCLSSALAAGDTRQNVQVGTQTRTYVLHVPAAYDGRKPVPLIVDFHSMPGSGAGELSSSPYPSVTDPEGVIMAFPDGMKGPIGTTWDLGPCCVADVDDLTFSRELVAQVEKLACIDEARVYAVGVLTGGGMPYYLACHASDVFAAVAPAAFDLWDESLIDCNPSRPISVISFRGTADRVPYAGGATALVPGMPLTFLGAKATLKKWAQLDRCTGTISSEDSNGCAAATGCPTGVEVTLCTTPGGADDAADARVAWPMLKRHSL